MFECLRRELSSQVGNRILCRLGGKQIRWLASKKPVYGTRDKKIVFDFVSRPSVNGQALSFDLVCRKIPIVPIQQKQSPQVRVYRAQREEMGPCLSGVAAFVGMEKGCLEK